MKRKPRAYQLLTFQELPDNNLKIYKEDQKKIRRSSEEHEEKIKRSSQENLEKLEKTLKKANFEIVANERIRASSS